MNCVKAFASPSLHHQVTRQDSLITSQNVPPSNGIFQLRTDMASKKKINKYKLEIESGKAQREKGEMGRKLGCQFFFFSPPFFSSVFVSFRLARLGAGRFKAALFHSMVCIIRGYRLGNLNAFYIKSPSRPSPSNPAPVYRKPSYFKLSTGLVTTRLVPFSPNL